MQRMIKRAREEGGFTLIELMIVIVILGILAGIVLFAVGGITDRGTTAACKTDLSTIQTGVEAYYAKTSGYPTHLVPDLTDPTLGNQFLRWDSGFTGSSGPGTGTSDVHTGTGYTITYDGAGGVTATGC
jgi:prepilin-type N-terminal cleavage/methylation domain-containing protein